MTNNEPLYIYVRVSSDQQYEEGHGLDNQIELGLEVKKQMGREPIVLNEGSQSSSDEDVTSRPVLMELLNGIEDGTIKHVWTYHSDRLSRNRSVSFTIQTSMMKNEVTLYTGQGQKYVMSDPQDVFMSNLFLSMSELDQTLRTQRLRRGRLSSVKQGGWRGGPPPFGYKLKNKRLVTNPETVPHLNLIYTLYSQGKTLGDITSILLNKGILTPRGNVLWNENSVLKVLQNTHYEGYYYYTDKSLKETVRVEVPPIMDPSLILTVRERLNKRVKTSNNKKRETLLQGLLFCAHCDSRYGQRTQKNPEYDSYFCRGNTERKRTLEGQDKLVCTNSSGVRTKSVNKNKTDQLIWETVLQTLRDSFTFKEGYKNETLSKKETYSDYENSQKTLTKKLNRDREKLKRLNEGRHQLLVDNLLDPGKPESIDLRKKLDETQLELTSSIEQTMSLIKDNLDNRKWVDWVSGFRTYIDDLLNNKNMDEKTIVERRNLLSGVVEGIHISTLSNEEHEVKVVFKLPYVDDKLLKNKDNTFTPEPGTRTRDLFLTNSDSRYTPKKK